jgi:transposase-like protein
MKCTHCGSEKYVKNGSFKGSQRFRCKECNRYFSDKVRKFTYSDKEKFIEMYLNNAGIRQSARILGCSHSLLIRWIKEYANRLRSEAQSSLDILPADTLPDVIEMDEIYTRIKKGLQGCRYGLLILDGEVKLLRM